MKNTIINFLIITAGFITTNISAQIVYENSTAVPNETPTKINIKNARNTSNAYYGVDLSINPDNGRAAGGISMGLAGSVHERYWLGHIHTNDFQPVGNFFINYGGQNRLTIDRTGNIGIGTTAPTSPLHLAKSGSYIDFLKGDNLTGQYSKAWINIHGKTGGAIQFTNQTTDNKSTIFSQNGDMSLVAGKELKFAVGGAFNHAFVMKEDGNVGIGTTNTFGYKLAVNGTIGAREMIIEVDNAWPDYVFADDYELKSLAETADFIAKNHHLPEMPSAAEVEENGIAVGEMNRLLLKKIEELTLHLIALKKENKEILDLSENQQQQIDKLNQFIELK